MTKKLALFAAFAMTAASAAPAAANGPGGLESVFESGTFCEINVADISIVRFGVNLAECNRLNRQRVAVACSRQDGEGRVPVYSAYYRLDNVGPRDYITNRRGRVAGYVGCSNIDEDAGDLG